MKKAPKRTEALPGACKPKFMTEQGGSPPLRSVFMCLYLKGQKKQKSAQGDSSDTVIRETVISSAENSKLSTWIIAEFTNECKPFRKVFRRIMRLAISLGMGYNHDI
jgi:hypothetical protein